MTDTQCISELSAGSTAEAFAQLVRRYAGLVYSTARRLVRDEHLAEDVTQATFVVLIKKARQVDPRFLPGWLVNTTRLTAKAALRSETRRDRHELASAAMRPVVEEGVDSLSMGEITPILDQALSHLKESDRTAVVMRFFEGKSFGEIAGAIGTTEEAARKRVTRSLQKMRGIFMRRGFAPSVGGLVVALASQQAEAAPAMVIRSLLASPLPAGSSAGSLIAGGALRTMKWAKVKVLVAALLGLGMLLAGTGLWWRHVQSSPAIAAAPIETPPAHAAPMDGPEERPDTSKYAAMPWRGWGGPDMHNAKGWPLHLPGEVCCTPVVADLLGDGHLEIVVSCRATGDPVKGITDGEPLLFAFRADGSCLPGWPIAIQENDPHKARNFEWMGSPSVFRRNGKDELVMEGAHAGVIVVRGNGTFFRISEEQKNWHDNIPLADLDGDGVPDIAIGKFIANVDGKHVRGWPPAKRLRDGYAPCIGDAFGDGRLEVFHLFYTSNDTGYPTVGGFDARGNSLPGWPKWVSAPSLFPPVMGDVLGNGQMQIIGAYGNYLFAWNPDGTPLPHTVSVEREELNGVLKFVYAIDASPSLVDLDGDGRAEIVVFDRWTHTIRAWHGDGMPVFHGEDTQSDKRIIAVHDVLMISQFYGIGFEVDENGRINAPGLGEMKAAGLTCKELAQAFRVRFQTARPGELLAVSVSVFEKHLQLDMAHPAAAEAPGRQAGPSLGGNPEVAESDGAVAVIPETAHGVSVVSLGDDPRRMDFFAGTYWVDRKPDGSTDVIDMSPGYDQTASVQPTVADVEGNGQADVIFGTEDGELFVYQTRLAYHPERMQWPTANGNFQHTGAWHKPPIAGR